jgi:hypothetical protein
MPQVVPGEAGPKLEKHEIAGTFSSPEICFQMVNNHDCPALAAYDPLNWNKNFPRDATGLSDGNPYSPPNACIS